VLGGLALVSVLAACGGSANSSSNNGTGSSTTSGSTPAAGTPKTGGSMTFALESESPDYVPGGSRLAYSGSAVEAAVYDPLTQYQPDGTAKPFLAQSVTANSTSTQWTVTLPSGIKFEDGTGVTAQDIVDDYNQYIVATGSSDAATFAEVKSVTATGPLTALFTLSAPDANFPIILTNFFTFNPDLKSKYGSSYGAHPDGTGPFKLVSWQPNNQIVLQANPYYWRKDSAGRQLPYLSSITLKIIPDGNTRTATLQSSGIAGFETVEAQLMSSASSLPGIAVDNVDTGGAGWFFNTQAAPTNDLRVREAITEATDRSAIIAALGAGSIVQPRVEYFGPNSEYYDPQAAAALPATDAAKAKATLQGYINDPKRTDGKPVGSPVNITLNYISADTQEGAAVQVAQSEWQAAGFKVTLNATDEATQVSDAAGGKDQAFFFEWANQPPFGLFEHNYLPSKEDPANWTKFDNPTVLGAIQSLAATTDLNQTKSLSHTINMVFAQQLPVDFLFSSDEGWIYSTSKVGGLTLTPGSKGGLGDNIDWALMWAK
jgi:peptide/nickel transport system substrate-binding protein